MIMLAKGNRSQQVTDACKNTAVSTSVVSVVRQQYWRREVLRAWNVLNIRNWEWKPSGKLKWKISRRLSLWMIKEMTSSSRYNSHSAPAV